jgi:hypothetical protein
MFKVDNIAEPVYGIQIGPGHLYNTHPETKCAGRHCVIHNQSDHHMKGWELNWRADLAIMERICPNHGTGHPDPDDLEYQKSIGKEWVTVHGCCGCCES